MSESFLRRRARPSGEQPPEGTPLSLEQLRKQAKELLRAYRCGDEGARGRFAAARARGSAAAGQRAVSLADAQFVLAREQGFATWARLKDHVEQTRRSRLLFYDGLANDLWAVCRAADGAALERLREVFGGPVGVEQVRARVGGGGATLADARLFVARLYRLEDWAELEASAGRAATASGGLSFRVAAKTRAAEPLGPVTARDWDEMFEAMAAHGITALRAGGQMTDAALERLAQRDLVTSLDLDGSRRVTDAGLRHLAAMPRLERLDLSGCAITDDGLAALRHLPALREFSLCHHDGVSDRGLAHLEACERLERVNLLGSAAGDGTIRALTGKAGLRHFRSGTGVTDGGVALLHEFPVFRTWRGKEPEYSLVWFDAEPNYLLLRGAITDRGLASLAGLDGLFALNVNDARLELTAAGVRSLAALPHLGWLGFDATDATMAQLAALPRLRMLLCQDTRAGDDGFVALGRSRTLEYVWGRRCGNLTGRGFAALARMPSLRGLAVSCRNVDDGALAELPAAPSLVELLPMDVADAGFRHVGRCKRLQALWCMYCRDTGDRATEQIAGLDCLTRYYAGQTRITDRSLEILGGMASLEELTFSACAGITNAGVAALGALPRLRELTIETMPQITRRAWAAFPAGVRVSLER